MLDVSLSSAGTRAPALTASMMTMLQLAPFAAMTIESSRTQTSLQSLVVLALAPLVQMVEAAVKAKAGLVVVVVRVAARLVFDGWLVAGHTSSNEELNELY